MKQEFASITKKIEEIDAQIEKNASDFVKLTELSKLDDASKTQLASLEGYCVQQQYEKKFSAIAEDIVIDESIVSKYSLSTVNANFTF